MQSEMAAFFAINDIYKKKKKMSSYIKLFETTSQYEAFTGTSAYIRPNISACIEGNKVYYAPLLGNKAIAYTASTKLTETTSSSSAGLHTNAFSGSNGSLTIVNHTFNNGEGIIEFDGDVTSIGSYAFINCGSLINITIPNSVTSIGIAVFDSCSSLTSVTIPDSVTSIGDSVFLSCRSLTSIVIPDSVTSMGNFVFEGCDGLTSVTIGNSVTSIGFGVFRRCESLTSITIPDSVTTIGNNAFSWCSSLTSVTLGSGITSIGNYAFGCSVPLDAASRAAISAINPAAIYCDEPE